MWRNKKSIASNTTPQSRRRNFRFAIKYVLFWDATRESYCHIWNQHPRICHMQIQGILNLGLTILLLRFFRIKLEKPLSYFKSVPWNFGICNARFNMKELKLWDQISLFSYFLDTIWKTIVIFGICTLVYVHMQSFI